MEGDQEYNPKKPVSFMTTDATGAATRGTPITSVSQMTDMGVFASNSGLTDWSEEAILDRMYNKELTYSSTTEKWNYNTGEEEYWDPESLADRYSFFAYAPYGTGTGTSGNGITVSGSEGTAGTPTLTYTVPTDVTNQPDLMVAVPQKNLRPSGAPVELAMEHALTSVAFQLAGQADKVTGLAVKGVKTTGTLTIDGENIVWTGLDGDATTDFSASLNYDTTGAGAGIYYTATEDMSTNLIKSNGYLMMIPQELESGAKVVVTYSDGTKKELAFAEETWLAGKKVTYNITLPDNTTPASDGGFLAPPGVIGYIKGTNQLTLKGSVEYSANADIAKYAEDNFDGLSDQTVYVAYFKYGSLVALSSDPTDVAAPYFEPLDVVKAPTEWKGSLQATRDYIGSDYEKVPFSTGWDWGNSGDWHPQASIQIEEDRSNGKGDACKYYFGTKHGGGWSMPSAFHPDGTTSAYYNRIDGMPDYDWSNMTRFNANQIAAGIPDGVLVNSSRSADKGMYFGRTGLRYGQEGGKLSSNSISEADGLYASDLVIYYRKADEDSGIYYYIEFRYDGNTIAPGYNGSTEGRSDRANNHGVALRCVRPKATVSLTPSTTSQFPVAGETRTFNISTTYFTGTPAVISSPSWATATISADGKTLTVTVAPNTGGTDRSSYVTVGAGSDTRSRTSLYISQSHTMGGMLAPPGVIGYIRGTNTLTLKGSKEYESNSAIKQYALANFGGLENETVYVAYFKFGSLIALSSDPNDTGTGLNSNYLQSNDIIAGPEGYNLDDLRAVMLESGNNNNHWSAIPYYPKSTSISSPDAPTSGKGDPCRYYFGNMYQDGYGFAPGHSWRLPTTTNNKYNGYSSMSSWSSSSSTLPVAGAFSTRRGETGMYYPATGHRHESTGQIEDLPGGIYWTSVSDGGDYGHFMYINSGNATSGDGLDDSYWIGRGHAVRCVKDAPTVTSSSYSYTFPKDAGSTTFTLSKGNYTGDYKVSDNADWITTDTIGNTLRVTVTENTATSPITRSGTVTVGVGTDYTGYSEAYITISQYHTVGGVLAPPGVIGYVKGTDSLTLKGSKEYSSNSSISAYADANFGGLSNSTVYIAYFRYGSLIALSSDPSDKDSSYFEAEDVIAGPAGYNLASLKASPNFGNVPYTSANTITNDPTNGRGDPCVYYFGDKFQTGKGFASGHSWRLPRIESVTSNSGNGSWYNGYTPDFWNNDRTWQPASGELPYGRMNVRTGETGMFYPATGFRDQNSGQVQEQGTGAIYWSSTNDGGEYGYFLYFSGTAPGQLDDKYYRWRGHPVRCVKDRPTVSAPSTSYSYPAQDSTVNIQITTGNYSIEPVPTVTYGSDWLSADIEPGTEAGKYQLIVHMNENPSTTADRSANVLVEVGSPYTGYASVLIGFTQRHALGGVYAPPGVIGYIKGTNTLTLKGSVEYKAMPAVEAYADAHFEGLSDKTVYIAYFKQGSLIALSGDTKDKNTGSNGRYIQSDDIIAGPTEWSGLYNLRYNPTWNTTNSDGYGIPWWYPRDLGNYGYSNTEINVFTNNPASSFGDPCRYYFDGKYDGNWKLPTRYDYNGINGNLSWTGSDGNQLSGVTDNRNGYFYPNSGWRSTDQGYVEQQLYRGLYWTSTSDGGSYGYYMYFGRNDGNRVEYPNADPYGHWDSNRAAAVRCIPQ
jgi:hypothetical protein